MLSRDEFVLFGKFLRRLGDIAKPLATNSSTKTEPLSTVLTEINLAAAMIIDQTQLITHLFAGVRDQLPYDVKNVIATLPEPGAASDQLLNLARVAERWHVRPQAAYERLVHAGAKMVFFGRVGYLRLSNLLAIEEKLSSPIKPFPSRVHRKVQAVPTT
jgi:hypothetical protein